MLGAYDANNNEFMKKVIIQNDVFGLLVRDRVRIDRKNIRIIIKEKWWSRGSDMKITKKYCNQKVSTIVVARARKIQS